MRLVSIELSCAYKNDLENIDYECMHNLLSLITIFFYFQILKKKIEVTCSFEWVKDFFAWFCYFY